MEQNTVVAHLLTGISQALYEAFGETYTIYADPVEQDVHMPCFFLQVAESSEQRHLAGHFLRSQLISVTLLAGEDDRIMLYGASEKLDACLEVVSLEEGKVRASRTHSEIVDGALVYTAEYTFRIVKPEAKEETMEHLELETRA